MHIIFFLLFFFSTFQLHSYDQIFIGPEWHHVKRIKAGGTKQDGNLFGFHAGYDRLNESGWYWGSDAYYAYGKLKGHSGQDVQLSSKLTDASIEGRIGFNFQICNIFFTPYVGVGYFWEKNNFVHPSPIPAHFKIHYPYGAIGFLCSMPLGDTWEIGVNFKTKMPYESRCRVSHDDENKPVTQNIATRLHYRVDVPITYQICYSYLTAIRLVPFYELRNYGKHPNFPFNFMKTKFYDYGLTLQFVSYFY